MGEEQVKTLSALLSNRLLEGGYFLTVEGGDGSGKTTVARLLARDLETSGVPVLLTREPGGTDLGVEVRNLVMHGPDDVDPRTEALLYAADRAYHVATKVRPALHRGEMVIGDRYIDSSVAYQGAARQLGIDEIRGLSEWATGGLYPDFTVYFDLDPTIALARTGSAPDRLESSGAQFHEQVRDQYLQMVKDFPERFALLDASGTVEENYHQLLQLLINRLEVTTGKNAS